MFYRLMLEYRRNTTSQLLKLVLFSILIAFVVSSFLVSGLSEMLEDNLSSQLELKVLTGSVVNNGNYKNTWIYNDSQEEFVDHMNSYLDRSVLIGEKADCYFDINIEFGNLYLYEKNGSDRYKSFINGADLYLNPNQVINLLMNSQYLQQRYDYDIEDLTEKFSSDVNINVLDYFSEEDILIAYGQASFTQPHAVADPLFQDLKNNNIVIVEGRTFTEEEMENGSPVCVIKKDSFIVNYTDGKITKQPLKTGDKINGFYNLNGWGISTEEKPYDVTFTVIGFYDDSSDAIPSINKLYVPYNWWNDIWHLSYDNIRNNNKPFFYQFFAGNAHYQAETLRKLDELMNIIIDNKDPLMSYYASTNELAELLSGISAIADNLNNMSVIMLAVSLLATAALIILDVYFQRKKLGILISLGTRKRNVVFQLIMENAVNILLAMPLVILLTNVITNQTIQYLLSGSITQYVFTFDGRTLLLIIMTTVIFMLVISSVTVLMINRINPKQLLEEQV